MDASQNVRLDAIDIMDASQNVRLGDIEIMDASQNVRLDAIDIMDASQNVRLDAIDIMDASQNVRLDAIDIMDASQNVRLGDIEIMDASQNVRLDAIESLNITQTSRLDGMNLSTVLATGNSANSIINLQDGSNNIYLNIGSGQVGIQIMDASNTNLITPAGISFQTLAPAIIQSSNGLTIPSTTIFNSSVGCLNPPILGTDLINLAYLQTFPPSQELLIYLNYSQSDASGNGTLEDVQTNTTQTKLSTIVTIGGEYQLIKTFKNFLANLPVGAYIPSGIWDLNLFCNLDTAHVIDPAQFLVKWRLFGVFNGVEIPIGGDVSGNNSAEYDLNTIAPSVALSDMPLFLSSNFDLSGCDSLVVKIYANNTDSLDASFNCYFEGSTYYSHLHTSFGVYTPQDILGLTNVWTSNNTFSAGLSSSAPTHITGGLYDVLGSEGISGQVLQSNGTGIQWTDVPGIITPTLAQVMASGNKAGTALDMSGNTITNALSVAATTFTGALSGNATTSSSCSGNATTATSSTNISGGLGGYIPYQSAVNTTTLLANGTTGQVLTSAGTTLAPIWSSGVSVADTNVSGTYYPTFVDGSGNGKTVYADIVGNAFSINPNTGLMKFSNSLNIKANSVCLGASAGATQTDGYCTAIGMLAGNSQGRNSTAVGYGAGQTMLSYSTAFGNAAGSNMGTQSCAIGASSGTTNMSSYSTALGALSGYSNLAQYATAIGFSAGQGTVSGLGLNSVAIGAYACQNSGFANSICINASGAALNTTQSGFYVKPVRSDATASNIPCLYNTATNEMSYGAVAQANVTGLTTSLQYVDATSSIQTQLNGKQVSGTYCDASTGQTLGGIKTFSSQISAPAGITGATGSFSYLNSSNKTVFTGDLVSHSTLNILEKVIPVTVSSNIATIDFSLGGVFYVTPGSAAFDISLNNVNSSASTATTCIVTLLINTSTYLFYGTTCRINGTVRTIVFAGGAANVSVTSATLIQQTLSIIYSGSATVPVVVMSSVVPFYA
jgi:hypothetical protein